MHLNRPMQFGDHVTITLQFERRPSLEADFVVREEPAS
jgi:copper(I)-binding protein